MKSRREYARRRHRVLVQLRQLRDRRWLRILSDPRRGGGEPAMDEDARSASINPNEQISERRTYRA